MDAPSTPIRNKVIIRFIAGIIGVAALLLLPAGSFLYVEGWIYMGVIFVPLIFAVPYFLKNNTGLLERRMKTREKEGEQKRIVLLAVIIFLIGFLIPGLDYRYQWSDVPVALGLAADVIVFLGYLVAFFTLRENSYASRIIEVDKEQKVIATGPYAYVRHPMYLGMIIMFLFTPLALGSYWAVIPFLVLPAFFVFRILNEEKMLLRDLPGYGDYCGKVRYRLVPGVW
ncbi:MAG: isoprenylcysteine carboxylmethyltransferase family protein [Methanomicrobiales archaeon]|nr:isoprenylcysteine carboxylmethyltransferase family protein [Methanomicrobiales archaeon]